jgi:hypothetical protein
MAAAELSLISISSHLVVLESPIATGGSDDGARCGGGSMYLAYQLVIESRKAEARSQKQHAPSHDRKMTRYECS